jgi:hypothetical protein
MEKHEELVEDQDFFEDGEDMSADEFMAGEGNFIKSPAVGEEVEFVLKGIKKQTAKRITNPKTGKSMDIKLSSVDYYYDFLSDDGKALSVTSWQIVGKTKAILKKLGGYGHKLKISHLLDGMKAPKDAEVWKVYVEIDGQFKELDRKSNKWV